MARAHSTHHSKAQWGADKFEYKESCISDFCNGISSQGNLKTLENQSLVAFKLRLQRQLKKKKKPNITIEKDKAYIKVLELVE